MWVWDAPTGVFKNHALSSDIRKEAIADAMFMRFLRAEPGYGKGKGESVTITRILQLPLANRVSETERLPSGRPALETKSVTVAEWGFKIELSDFDRRLSHFNIMDPYQQLLRDQMSLTMDVMSAEALRTTPYKYIPVSTGGVFDTDGTPSTVADKNMDVNDLRVIHDELRGTLKCPPFRNGKYVGLLSTKAARGIKNDPEFKDWIAPTGNSPFITGMLKDIEGFTLFETNHFAALPNAVGSGGILGEAVFFGADAGGLAVVMDPELRAGLPEDLGRFRQVGWVGILEAFLVWEKAAQSRVVHVTSQ